MSSSDDEDDSENDSRYQEESDNSSVDITEEINRTTASSGEEANTASATFLLRGRNALKDVALIREIFTYVDQTSKRITHSLVLNDDCSRLRNENGRLLGLLQMNEERKMRVSLAEKCPEDENICENESITWSQYEELDDGQRAQLLEKSLLILNVNSKKLSEKL